jgi:hypothetical protein
MTQTELAAQLNIGQPQASRWLKEGMPRDPIAAQKWIGRHKLQRSRGCLPGTPIRATLAAERRLDPSEVTDTGIDEVEFFSENPEIDSTLKNMSKQDRLALLKILQAGASRP